LPSASNAVEEAAQLLRDRIRELDAERAQLEKALQSLGAAPRGSASRSQGTRRGSRNGLPRISQRRRKGGTRAEQAVKLIGENPGISAGEIAKQLKLKPNYMYRVLSDLQEAGHVVKNGRSYSLPDAPPAASPTPEPTAD